jgi:hypothetical protein
VIAWVGFSFFFFVGNRTGWLGLAVRSCCNEIDGIPRNGLSIHLPNGMLHSKNIAARGFCGVARRVLGNLCLANLEQEFTLFS